jgi:hypothetical protein
MVAAQPEELHRRQVQFFDAKRSSQTMAVGEPTQQLHLAHFLNLPQSPVIKTHHRYPRKLGQDASRISRRTFGSGLAVYFASPGLKSIVPEESEVARGQGDASWGNPQWRGREVRRWESMNSRELWWKTTTIRSIPLHF